MPVVGPDSRSVRHRARGDLVRPPGRRGPPARGCVDPHAVRPSPAVQPHCVDEQLLWGTGTPTNLAIPARARGVRRRHTAIASGDHIGPGSATRTSGPRGNGAGSDGYPVHSRAWERQLGSDRTPIRRTCSPWDQLQHVLAATAGQLSDLHSFGVPLDQSITVMSTAPRLLPASSSRQPPPSRRAASVLP